ncbi:MAG: ACP S-malonyltransferase [Chloroflexota bacterium]|nr:ACP S-malonyltransferase [Chloroflexota bacterium]
MSFAVLFSPQGSQAVGMGRELAERSDPARATFAEADTVLGWSVSGTCWEGPPDRLDDTRQTQACLLTTSIAAYRALREQVDVEPGVVAGHSVGEYAALVAAGVLDFESSLRLVSRRAELMAAAATDGGMAAVIGLERATVEAVVASVGRPTELVVANDNAPGQVVISGRRDALDAATEPMREAGARRVLRLPVSGAFHSPLMTDVSDGLASAFEGEDWHDARIPVISNVTAEPLTDPDRIRSLLAEQVRSPVEWVRSIQHMHAHGVDLAIECGPGSALTGMVRRIVPDMRIANVGDAASLEATAAVLRSGVPMSISA